MSDESQTKRDNALEFLDELDGRHDLLLDELEKLNNRIDSVLSDYTKSRQSAAQPDGAASPFLLGLGSATTEIGTAGSRVSVNPQEISEDLD